MKFLIAIALLGLVSAHKMMAGDGDRGDRRHGMMFGGFGDKMFAFFKGLEPAAVQELHAIWKNENNTIAQQKQAVLTWAEKYNRSEQVTEHFTNISNWKTAMQKNVTNLISQLNAVNSELQNIFNNEQQTRAAMFEAIEELRNSSRQAVDVIFAIPRIAFGHHGKGGDHRQGGHMKEMARGGHGRHSGNMGAAGAAFIMGTHMLSNGAMGGNKAHPMMAHPANKMAAHPGMHSNVHHG